MVVSCDIMQTYSLVPINLYSARSMNLEISMSGTQEDHSQPILLKMVENTTRLSIPLNVTFEITYRCNLRCRHCYLPDHSDHGELTTQEIFRILDELAEAKCLYLTLTGGEIFTRSDFFEIAEHARKKNFALRLFTNGTLIDESVADRIGELGPFTVDISIYGSKPETHDWVTKHPGSFETSIQAVKMLRARGVRTLLKFPLMDCNVNEYEGIMHLGDELDSEYRFDPNIVPQNNGCDEPLALRVKDEDLRKVFKDKRLFPQCGQQEIMGETASPICEAGRNSCSINPYGEVFPCLQLLLNAGNLREKSFGEIWKNSEILKKLRGLKVKDLPECSVCKLAYWCNRCPGLALLEDGNLLGCSKRARKVAEIRKEISEKEACPSSIEALSR